MESRVESEEVGLLHWWGGLRGAERKLGTDRKMEETLPD